MKGSSMNTHMGNIVIDNEVIAQYAGSVAVEDVYKRQKELSLKVSNPANTAV